MSFRLQVLLFLIIIIGVLYIIKLVKKKIMDLRYALIWIIISICILVLILFPNVLNKIAELLGIASPVNMLFFFSFCFSIVIILSLSVALSRLSEKVKRMAQEIAIMRKDMYVEKRVRELEEEQRDVKQKEHNMRIAEKEF